MIPILTADTLPVDQFVRMVPARTAEQGRELHDRGHTQVQSSEPTNAVMSVSPPNERPAQVTIRLSGTQVSLSCSCRGPYAWGACKHGIAGVYALRDHLRQNPPSLWRAVLGQALAAPKTTSPRTTAAQGALLFSVQPYGHTWFIQPYSLHGRYLPPDHDGNPDIIAAAIKERNLWDELKPLRNTSNLAAYSAMPAQALTAAALALGSSNPYNNNYWQGSPRQIAGVLSLLPGCLVYRGEYADAFQERLYVHNQPGAIQLELARAEGELAVRAVVTTDDAPVALHGKDITMLTSEPNWAIIGNQLLPLAGGGVVELLMRYPNVRIPAADETEFLERFVPELVERLPLTGDAVTFENLAVAPEPRLYLSERERDLVAELRFGYAEFELPYNKLSSAQTVRRRPESRTLVRISRDLAAEQAAWEALSDFGLKRGQVAHEFLLRKNVAPIDFLIRQVPRLTEAGYVIFGEEALKSARVNRNRPEISFKVSSGIDWFDLQATVSFGDQHVPLKEIRRAVRKRERFIKLADGTIGAIPPEWIERYRHLFALAEDNGNDLRLSNHHLSLLDQVLAEADRAQTDAAFQERRERLRNFERIEPQPLPQGFTGTLRPYQKAAFDWMHFLNSYGFGGCLADDMGTGKCVAADTHILVNGTLQTAADIWARYAGSSLFDGEGEWAEPVTALSVNALDEQNRRIVPAPVARLYRQQVHERMRTVHLDDGSRITITYRHKLLGRDGWTTNLKPGDVVCVPAQHAVTASLHATPLLRAGEGMGVRATDAWEQRPTPEGTEDEEQDNAEVHFCTITAVEEVWYDGWVYDLEIAEHHNFVAEGILCHNTISTLAFLQALKERAPDAPATLIVMPRSLLFNWAREAAQFTPGLRVYTHADQGRISDAADFSRHDLVLTTYGVMLRDIELLRSYRFNYAILDESQAIKNPLAETSRAARSLNADHRLVLTGTPVENSASELWAQFAFLNPGLLGNLDYFREEFVTPIERKQDNDTATFLRKMVHPFILRRTKEQVALDLPPRSEELLEVDMDPAQRKLYIKTRDHYRDLLLGLIDDEGINDARLKVLEGLLRLRQICNHPRLVEPTHRGGSAKLEALLETLDTLRAEGHKALIFSQFVQMLTIVRSELDARKIPYAYLDGSTRKRKEVVDQFQESGPELPFFLISLKAGGVGLNLTAADYVIHVDPWWNPAVEMQATDRTHRIGQTRPVFVYKLITRGTVEEKILELQARKRALVEQLIAADGGMLKALTREDVEVLFS